MRYKGKITEWNDDKGFGFVSPKGGEPRVFVHIKSFSNRQRRPIGNEFVTYELISDARGRPQGANVAFVGHRPSSRLRRAPGPGAVALTFAAVFIAFLVGAAATGKLLFVVLIAYFIANCVAYMAYFIDKSAALKGQWRISESTLHILSLLGGWPAAMLAQRMLRHKTQKQAFQVAYWVTVVINCAVSGWLLSPGGMNAVKSLMDAM